MKITLELVERFHEKWELNKDTGCWEWTASTAGRGYGQIKKPGTRKQIYAHRLSYLIHYGELKDSDLVCHTCDNQICVKPSHLFLGDAKTNLLDMKEKGRHLYGERNMVHKLTEEMVLQIHKLSQEGLSQSKIGRTFGIAQGTVFKIIHGERWNHVFKKLYPGRD